MALAFLWFKKKPESVEEFTDMVSALEYGINIGVIGNTTFETQKK